jgi:hypothetical protein
MKKQTPLALDSILIVTHQNQKVLARAYLYQYLGSTFWQVDNLRVSALSRGQRLG